MQPDTVSLVRAAYDAFNEGRIADWAAANLPDDFELVPRAAVGGSGFIGPEGVATFFADVTEAWESSRIEIEDVVEFGDRIVILGRLHNRGRGSGMELDVIAAHLWTVADGVLVRVEMIGDRDEALRRARA